MVKRIIALFITAVILLMCNNVLADYDEYMLGAYYQLGKYNEKPIVWRCVGTDDENGILMVSDKILCYKAANVGETPNSFASANWEESSIRIWLNSKEELVKWMNNNIPNKDNLPDEDWEYAYDNECGFLFENNFSKRELSVMKTVSQWQAVPIDRLDLSTNDVMQPFISSYSRQASYGEWKSVGWIQINDLKNAYKGAMYRISDTIFLLNEAQAYSVYQVYGTCSVDSDNDNVSTKLNAGCYWLRSPYQEIQYDNGTQMMTLLTSNDNYGGGVVKYAYGVRPAFYLNEDTSRIISGSGTEDDPYILDGIEQEEITVFANGKQVNFNQEPMIENDRTLVGMRAIFESLGAEVEWNGEEQSVTASTDDTTVKLQIDNNIMQVNDNKVELDTPARLVNDNTMVPLRAVSEALDAKVEWIEELQRIVIDKQPEWIESDWNPEWYQQAMRAGGYY